MSFAIGQKVECIATFNNFELVAAFAMNLTLPKKGSIYHIRSVQSCDCGRNHTWVRLREIVNAVGVTGEENAFCSSMFVPVIEHKTSIEIFTRMLNPTSKEIEKVGS